MFEDTPLEWDETKRQENLQKHGVDFAGLASLFQGDVTFELDTRRAYDEERFIVYGVVYDTVYAVVCTPRPSALRLISARKADTSEREEYYRELYNPF